MRRRKVTPEDVLAIAYNNPQVQVNDQRNRPPKRGAIVPGQTEKYQKSEHEEQADLVAWAKGHTGSYPELALLHAIPNGGHRPGGTGGKLKAEGVLPGIPDLFLPVARRYFHGLYIEMKVGSNKPSAEQKAIMEALQKNRYYVALCYSAQSARGVLLWYLGYA